MNVWLVARHEYRRHVVKRSFLLALLSVPILAAVALGVNVLTGSLSAPAPAADLSSLGQFLPAAAGLALVLLIFFSSGYLLEALVEEKANRAVEIIVTSISPGQLMAGKVLGIIAVTLTQLAAWGALLTPILFLAGRRLGLPGLEDIRLDVPATLVMLALVIPCYVLVAALMTAIGATQVARAGQQITTMFAILYLVPMTSALSVLRTPDSALSVGLSLFPISAPAILPLRAAFGQVPFWQIAASVTIECLCALGALWLAGRAFRLGMLRYGRRLRFGDLLGALAPRRSGGTRPAGRRGEERESTRAEDAGGWAAASKTWRVLRHEFFTALTRPSYLLLVVGFPLFLFLNLLVLQATAPQSLPSGEGVFQLLLTRYLPILVTLLLYGSVLMASNTLLNGLSDEKRNRVMEVLLLSVEPHQLLTGKFVALALAGLLQVASWGGIGGLIFALSGRQLDLSGISLPPTLLWWGLLFFLLGYATYASLIAGAGVLTPNVKESPYALLVLFLPAWIAFAVALNTAEHPHGALPTLLSLFPLTAPVSMLHRVVAGGVPLWQLLLSIVLMLGTIPLIMRATARLFHAQHLLSGQPFSVQRYLRALLGQG